MARLRYLDIRPGSSVANWPITSGPFSASVVFAGLSGEEQDLYGGRIVAGHALREGWRIRAVLNNDMIGNISGINGVTDNTTARVFSEGTRHVETEEEARTRRFSGFGQAPGVAFKAVLTRIND